MREKKASVRLTLCDTLQNRDLEEALLSVISQRAWEAVREIPGEEKERETGLEPATACLEGRLFQNRHPLAIDRL